MATRKKPVRYAVVDETGGQVGVLVDVDEYERLHEAARELEELRHPGKRPRNGKSRRFSFADLAGTLRWKGDAVAEQRRLRDEW
jgi:hypothetical protein